MGDNPEFRTSCANFMRLREDFALESEGPLPPQDWCSHNTVTSPAKRAELCREPCSPCIFLRIRHCANYSHQRVPAFYPKFWRSGHAVTSLSDLCSLRHLKRPPDHTAQAFDYKGRNSMPSPSGTRDSQVEPLGSLFPSRQGVHPEPWFFFPVSSL